MMNKKLRIWKDRLIMTPIMIMHVILAIIILLPIFWVLMSSFKPEPKIIAYPPTLTPESFTINNFIKVQQRIDIMGYIKNSLIYAFGATIPAIFINSLAAYAFARYKFKGKDILFMIFLATMMVPFQVIMVPLFLEVHAFGMYNTYHGLIIPRVASAYWIFMLRAAFAGLPKELEEAARIDGLTEFGIYHRIMMPQIVPAIITMLILGVNGNWNDLLWPLLMTSSVRMTMLANGLAIFVGSRTSEYGAAFAGSFLSLIPMLALYIFGQKYFVEGQVTTGLKG
ncbi:MAG: carbohydrate ABC transporter permease [Treponema sp.]|jgi:multiple sugar transport system permease protein|nr:carbohydrate ABC transporter permease [Treponema sp.]